MPIVGDEECFLCGIVRPLMSLRQLVSRDSERFDRLEGLGHECQVVSVEPVKGNPAAYC